MRTLPYAVALLLAGCSLSEVALSPQQDTAGPTPNYRKLIATSLVAIVGDHKRAHEMRISGVRRVDSLMGPAWLVCLRADAETKPLDYAILIQEERIVDSRTAARTDQCQEQIYEPFGAFVDSQRAIR